MKKPSRKSLIRKLDQIVSKIVRLRDQRCVVCGSNYMLQAGHVFSRKNYNARWDLDNVFANCAGCNIRHNTDPMPYYDWYQAKFGKDKFREVYNRWKEISHFKDFELIEMYEKLLKIYGSREK